MKGDITEKQLVFIEKLIIERVVDDAHMALLNHERLVYTMKPEASKMITWLLAQPKKVAAVTNAQTMAAAALNIPVPQDVKPATMAAEGYYQRDGKIYRVNFNQAGTRRYASVLILPAYKGGKARWDIAKGMVYKLADGDKLTKEQAKEFGHLYGHCCCCGKQLTVPASVEAGIGPKCAAKNSF